MFKLQRHSDHHSNSYKPYQNLNSYPESPTLPQGYFGCIVMALIPPVWFKVMNPMAEAVNKNEKISEEKQKEINLVMYTTLFLAMAAITYFTFVYIGLNPKVV